MNAPLPSPIALALEFLAVREHNADAAFKIATQLARRTLEAPTSDFTLSWRAELEVVIPLARAAAIQAEASVDSIEREDKVRVESGLPSQIINLSSRRRGMRLRHALRLPD